MFSTSPIKQTKNVPATTKKLIINWVAVFPSRLFWQAPNETFVGQAI